MIDNITDTTTATQSAVRMPLSHPSTSALRGAFQGASQGGVPVAAVAERRRLVRDAVVCSYRAMGVFATQGAVKGFPGPSAWSPPT